MSILKNIHDNVSQFDKLVAELFAQLLHCVWLEFEYPDVIEVKKVATLSGHILMYCMQCYIQ